MLIVAVITFPAWNTSVRTIRTTTADQLELRSQSTRSVLKYRGLDRTHVAIDLVEQCWSKSTDECHD